MRILCPSCAKLKKGPCSLRLKEFWIPFAPHVGNPFSHISSLELHWFQQPHPCGFSILSDLIRYAWLPISSAYTWTPDVHFGKVGAPQTANETIFEAFHLGFLISYRNIPVTHIGLTAAKLSLSLILALHPESQQHSAVESKQKTTFQTHPDQGCCGILDRPWPRDAMGYRHLWAVLSRLQNKLLVLQDMNFCIHIDQRGPGLDEY